MKASYQKKEKGRFARIFIWSIYHQDVIAHHIRIYVWSAVAIILLLSVAQRIPLELALLALLFCGIILGIGIWVAIERRRSWLLGITDPKLRQEAYVAMLNYLAHKTHERHNHRNTLTHLDQSEIEQN